MAVTLPDANGDGNAITGEVEVRVDLDLQRDVVAGILPVWRPLLERVHDQSATGAAIPAGPTQLLEMASSIVVERRPGEVQQHVSLLWLRHCVHRWCLHGWTTAGSAPEEGFGARMRTMLDGSAVAHVNTFEVGPRAGPSSGPAGSGRIELNCLLLARAVRLMNVDDVRFTHSKDRPGPRVDTAEIYDKTRPNDESDTAA